MKEYKHIMVSVVRPFASRVKTFKLPFGEETIEVEYDCDVLKDNYRTLAPAFGLTELSESTRSDRYNYIKAVLDAFFNGDVRILPFGFYEICQFIEAPLLNEDGAATDEDYIQSTIKSQMYTFMLTMAFKEQLTDTVELVIRNAATSGISPIAKRQQYDTMIEGTLPISDIDYRYRLSHVYKYDFLEDILPVLMKVPGYEHKAYASEYIKHFTRIDEEGNMVIVVLEHGDRCRLFVGPDLDSGLSYHGNRLDYYLLMKKYDVATSIKALDNVPTSTTDRIC